MATIPIQCNCGAIKLELTGEPLAQFYCHCDDCQTVHGGAYIPVAVYPRDAVRLVAGEPKQWKLKVTPRASCPECGTRLFADPPKAGFRGVLATLLPKGMFKPAFHIQCQHAMNPVKDDLPHYKSFPAMFGGSDEKVAW